MGASVARIHHRLGRAGGYATLEQSFAFRGASAQRIAETLWTAPVFGAASLLGDMNHREVLDTEDARMVRGFSPVPGFRFDFTVRRIEGEPSGFAVEFTQPDRAVAYLRGRLGWWIEDAADGCVFREEINTAAALALGQPLTGPRASVRRWLFFRVGHGQVMAALTDGLARLA